MKSDYLKNLRARAEENEEKRLTPYAHRSCEHIRLEGREDDHRLPYRRDVDRIVHSKAFARYTDKTQVAYLIDNDHITHRGLHVQFVSNFSRGIAETLGLNIDLVEAIALGHDVGHPPFGHEGEKYLSAITKKVGGVEFAHSLQSCRMFSLIEPRNLCLATLDGFLTHDGGMRETCIEPSLNKSVEEHFADRQKKLDDPNCNLSPMTLEGCLVKICDTMSYIGRDIEDAIKLGLINRSDVPATCLGSSNRELLTTLALDITECSDGKGYIALSEKAFAAAKILRTFNFQNIYIHPKLKVESEKVKSSYRLLFDLLMEDITKKGDSGHVFSHFLANKSAEYLESSSDIQRVTDYISGMTDNYFLKVLQKFVVPSRIEIMR